MTKNFYVWITVFVALIVTTVAIVAFSQPANVPIVFGIHPVDLAGDVSGQLPTGNILDDTILEADLDATNSPVVDYYPAYEAGGGFTWKVIPGASSPDLSDVLAVANTTGGSDISVDVADSIVGTGTFDGDSFAAVRIETGGTLALATAGDIGVDTTDDQFQFYSGGAANVVVGLKTLGFFTVLPTAGDHFIFWKAPYDLTILGIDCHTTVSTYTATIEIEEWSSIVVYQNDVDSSSIVCDPGGEADDGSLTDPNIDAGDWLAVNVSAANIFPGELGVTIRYIIDAS